MTIVEDDDGMLVRAISANTETERQKMIAARDKAKADPDLRQGYLPTLDCHHAWNRGFMDGWLAKSLQGAGHGQG